MLEPAVVTHPSSGDRPYPEPRPYFRRLRPCSGTLADGHEHVTIKVRRHRRSNDRKHCVSARTPDTVVRQADPAEGFVKFFFSESEYRAICQFPFCLALPPLLSAFCFALRTGVAHASRQPVTKCQEMGEKT